MLNTVKSPWSQQWEIVVDTLEVDPKKGLSTREAKVRQKQFGPNKLQKIKDKNALLIFIEQFKSFIVALLAVAVLVSFLFGERVEGFAVIAVILINAIIGFFTELKAVRSMEALRRMSALKTKVLRQGITVEVDARNIVPGDVVVFEGGDIITADLRIVDVSKLQVDESTFTGESLPVGKTETPVAEDAALHERTNMLYKGTSVTRGSGSAVVVATGMQTELGEISSLVAGAKEEQTPLEKRLDQLGYRLIWATLIIVAATAVAGVVSGKSLMLMIKTSIALAIAAIPEGLPIVATIALARGMYRMARKNVLINRLSAVETLGATSIICTDKTGTLTMNQMTVDRLESQSGSISAEDISKLNSDETFVQMLKVAVLCNNATLPEEIQGEKGSAIGDPMEAALLQLGLSAGVTRKELTAKYPEIREEAFDSVIKMMATVHESEDGYFYAVKGAPEEVLQCCALDEQERENWIRKNGELASNGLRVLAFASRQSENPDQDPYHNLTFLGLMALLDPPREEVKSAIRLCKDAGIRIIMITGDQEQTARSIGVAVGIIDDINAEVAPGSSIQNIKDLDENSAAKLRRIPIFSRVSPRQKLELIEIHQKNNQIVAMTGDGVNDAPALKKADIGVAMGLRGTQVAQDASDMILKTDSFSAIVAAVEQGRTIFENIRKFVLYLLSCNVSEILTVSIAAFFGLPLPLLPLQILFLNLVTDVFPALALGVSAGERNVMNFQPRNPKEAILTKEHWWAVGGYSALITISVLGALTVALKALKIEQEQAVTISFLTLALCQLWHVFNMRNVGSSFIKNEITKNRYVWGALLLCILLLAGALYIPLFSGILHLQAPSAVGWLLVLGMSIVPLLAGQLSIAIRGRKKRSVGVDKD